MALGAPAGLAVGDHDRKTAKAVWSRSGRSSRVSRTSSSKSSSSSGSSSRNSCSSAPRRGRHGRAARSARRRARTRPPGSGRASRRAAARSRSRRHREPRRCRRAARTAGAPHEPDTAVAHVESLCEEAGVGTAPKSTVARSCAELHERFEACSRRASTRSSPWSFSLTRSTWPSAPAARRRRDVRLGDHRKRRTRAGFGTSRRARTKRTGSSWDATSPLAACPRRAWSSPTARPR